MYNSQGVAGFYYHDLQGVNTGSYTYRKNLLGDIIGIYEEDSTCIAKYKYDAWGNCTVCNSDGTANTSASFIGNINPFRYRGYYWDKDLQLYYLQTRWYDPAIGRFISPDSVEYLDPESFGGLNLYCYCLNNPIMYVDPSGCIPIGTTLDIISVAWSLKDFIEKPTVMNGVWLALDIAFAIVPVLTGSKIIRVASKLDEVSYIGKGINRFDDFYDTVVIGNDMHRVMDRVMDIGATFYGGYTSLNALSALHDLIVLQMQ